MSTGDAITWKWTRGAATTVEELGDPRAGTAYAFCIYDGTGALTVDLLVPSAGTCGTKPCWRATGTRGFTYADRQRASDGVRTVRLTAGAAGRAAMQLSAKGPAMRLGSPGDIGLPIRVQLQGDGVCWGATFAVDQSPAVDVLKAKSD